MITPAALKKLVADSLKVAEMAIEGVLLEKIAKSMLADVPAFKALKLGSATKVSAAVLFVDLRGSTKRALRIGPRATFLTMHALLPPLAKLIESYDGYIVGYRGDGLFGVFGVGEDGSNPDGFQLKEVLSTAAACGQHMVEAVEEIVCPALEARKVEGGLRIGVGIDAGEIIVTRIGLPLGYELTAYGDAINAASKLCAKADGVVLLSNAVDDLYPTSAAGRVKTTALSDGSGYRLHMPARMTDES
jgi:class 3 adenylate cyclase